MTVGELKKLLETYPDNTEIVSIGFDSGGYDAIFSTKVRIGMWEDSNPDLYPDNKSEQKFRKPFVGKILIDGVDERD